MTIEVREARAEDTTALWEVQRAVLPFEVRHPMTFAREADWLPRGRRGRLLLAERAGRVVGLGRALVFTDAAVPGVAGVTCLVLPEHRGLGVGSALLAAAEEHLASVGGERLYAWVLDDGGSSGFAERRGYVRGRASRSLRRDLDVPLPQAPTLPPGVRLRTAAAYADDPRPLYEADLECARDEPGEVETGYAELPEWVATHWERPEWDKELTTVLEVDGTVAAFSVAHTDGVDRYYSGMTGTRRAFRGRGLARAAKHDSLRRSRQAGYRWAFTCNDAGNEPMLAVNRWFGYEECALEWRYQKAL